MKTPLRHRVLSWSICLLVVWVSVLAFRRFAEKTFETYTLQAAAQRKFKATSVLFSAYSETVEELSGATTKPKRSRTPSTLKDWIQACLGAGIIIVPLVFGLARLFTQVRTWTSPRSPVQPPTGFLLLRWSLVIFSSKALERVIQPVIADMQFEHYEALRAAQRAAQTGNVEEHRYHLMRARIAVVRGYVAFLFAALGVVLGAIGDIVKLWKSAH